MTTLADITFQAAKEILDVLEGTVESATATSLTDTANLIQDDSYFASGTLWFRSGANSGRVKVVSTHKANMLSWAGNLTAPTAGDSYAVCRRLLPYRLLKQAVNNALEVQEAFVLTENATIVADGSARYTLPAGVSKIKHVELIAPDGSRTPDFHHREILGKIAFDNPPSGATLSLQYRAQHPVLSSDTDSINGEINLTWLKWKTIEQALRWGYRELRNDPVLKVDVFLNEAIDKLKTLSPRDSVDVSVRMGG